MLSNQDIFTQVTIHGFTINPIIRAPMLRAILFGLTDYEDYHVCDHGEVDAKHKNYLGKRISDPIVVMNKTEKDHGLTGMCFLENGYFVIKIWDNVYPAQIQFDLFLTDNIEDLDLILDHLCAPASPWDGLGMFDYTYSKSSFPPKSHVLEKQDIDKSSYFINPPIKFLKNNKDWEVTLNQLSGIYCHFCENKSSDFVLTQTNKMHHASFKIVSVCEHHKSSGRVGEHDPRSEKQFSSLGFYTSKDDLSLSLDKVYDEKTGKFYSVNILEIGEEDETVK